VGEAEGRGGRWRLILLERYQREDVVSRLGTRVPGIFVAHEEVERLMRLWYLACGDGMAIAKVDSLNIEHHGIEEVY